MWALVNDGVIVQTINHPKPITIGDFKHPKEIFTRAWTDAERKAVGILPYVFEGDSNKNNMFYTTSESSPSVGSDSVVITRTQAGKTVSDIKTAMKNITNSVIASYLSQTDWIIIRKADTGENAPADLAQWRTDLRARAVEIETAIDDKSSVADLEAMMTPTPAQIQTYEDDLAAAEEGEEVIPPVGVFYDWPKNPRD